MKTIEYPEGYNKEKGITKEERRGCWLFTGLLFSGAIVIIVYGIVCLIITLAGK